MGRVPDYEPVKRISGRDAAARVFEVMKNQADRVFTIEQLMEWTNLRRFQVRNGERYLKEYLNRHQDEMGDYTLYIALSKESQHGLIRNDDASLLDAVARLRYMSARAASELDHREQQMKRVKDTTVRKHLSRGITYQRAAKEAFADAYERIQNGSK